MSKEICRLEEGHNLFPLEYRLSAGKPFPQKPQKCSLQETQASWWKSSREKVLWEVENNNPNSFSPRKNAGENIFMRPFVCGWVSTCGSEWVRDSVTLFIEDAIQTFIFVRSLSNLIHKSTIRRGGILLIFGQSQRLRSPLALCLWNIVGLIQISVFAK